MKVTKKQIIALVFLLLIVFSLPIAIFLAKKGQEIRPHALQGQANFLLSSDSTISSVGKVINVVVSMKLADSTVKASGVDFLLLYDKSKLDVLNIVPQVKSVDPAAPFTDAPVVTSGGIFDDTYNFVRVVEIARVADQYLPAGTITLARITFVGRGTGSATIKFPDDNKYLQIVGTGTYIGIGVTGGPPVTILPVTSSPLPTTAVSPISGPSATAGPPNTGPNSACLTKCGQLGSQYNISNSDCITACTSMDNCVNRCTGSGYAKTICQQSICNVIYGIQQ